MNSPLVRLCSLQVWPEERENLIVFLPAVVGAVGSVGNAPSIRSSLILRQKRAFSKGWGKRAPTDEPSCSIGASVFPSPTLSTALFLSPLLSRSGASMARRISRRKSYPSTISWGAHSKPGRTLPKPVLSEVEGEESHSICRIHP